MKILQKCEYVKNSENTNTEHKCHWIGCNESVKPAMWGCSKHWYKLPQYLRNKIWSTYKPEQENSKNPSKEYLLAATEVQQWILANNKTIK